jgi:hypothetical protein
MIARTTVILRSHAQHGVSKDSDTQSFFEARKCSHLRSERKALIRDDG